MGRPWGRTCGADVRAGQARCVPSQPPPSGPWTSQRGACVVCAPPAPPRPPEPVGSWTRTLHHPVQTPVAPHPARAARQRRKGPPSRAGPRRTDTWPKSRCAGIAQRRYRVPTARSRRRSATHNPGGNRLASSRAATPGTRVHAKRPRAMMRTKYTNSMAVRTASVAPWVARRTRGSSLPSSRIIGHVRPSEAQAHAPYTRGSIITKPSGTAASSCASPPRQPLVAACMATTPPLPPWTGAAVVRTHAR